jgi:hypothetical protein
MSHDAQTATSTRTHTHTHTHTHAHAWGTCHERDDARAHKTAEHVNRKACHTTTSVATDEPRCKRSRDQRLGSYVELIVEQRHTRTHGTFPASSASLNVPADLTNSSTSNFRSAIIACSPPSPTHSKASARTQKGRKHKMCSLAKVQKKPKDQLQRVLSRELCTSTLHSSPFAKRPTCTAAVINLRFFWLGRGVPLRGLCCVVLLNTSVSTDQHPTL